MIVTFFPVVLNTVQGLTQVDPLKLELLRAYAARPREIFFKLRLPNSLPYLFNALKLAAVIAVVSVIVAQPSGGKALEVVRLVAIDDLQPDIGGVLDEAVAHPPC